jgi:hypothetical protein
VWLAPFPSVLSTCHGSSPYQQKKKPEVGCAYFGLSGLIPGVKTFIRATGISYAPEYTT